MTKRTKEGDGSQAETRDEQLHYPEAASAYGCSLRMAAIHQPRSDHYYLKGKTNIGFAWPLDVVTNHIV